MSFNIDFISLLVQLGLDLVIAVGLVLYLRFTYSWETNTKQEEMANNQFHQIRENLRKKQSKGGFGGEADNSAQESLLPRESRLEESDRKINIGDDLTAIIPNVTSINHRASARHQQRNFMESMNNGSEGKPSLH